MAARGMYDQAHLFVAGIRIYEHLNACPPALEHLEGMLRISREELALVSRRLKELGIIKGVMSGSGEHFFVSDHTQIEALPREPERIKMAEEITLFRQQQGERLDSIERSLKSKETKSSIFEELERALKDPSTVRKKKNPLD